MTASTESKGAITVKGVTFAYAPLDINSLSINHSAAFSYSEAEHPPVQLDEKYPLRGTIESYIDPTEPVGEDDWEVLE